MAEKKKLWDFPSDINVNITSNDVKIEQLRTEVSGMAFALAAFSQTIIKKLDAIIKKIADPSDTEIEAVVASIHEDTKKLQDALAAHSPK